MHESGEEKRIEELEGPGDTSCPLQRDVCPEKKKQRFLQYLLNLQNDAGI